MKRSSPKNVAATLAVWLAFAGAPAVAYAAPEVTSVAMGAGGICALDTAGAVDCWGGSYAFDVDDDIAKAPHRIGNLVAKAIAVGKDACAIDESGAVLCAGRDEVAAAARRGDEELPEDSADPGATAWHPVPGVPKAKAIALGPFHACAITTSNDLVCWGAGYENRTGGSEAPHVVAGVTAVTAVALEEHGTCALSSDKKIRCFGDFDLGPAAGDPKKTVVVAPIPASKDLAVASGYVCGLADDGLGVTCAGDTTNLDGKDGAHAVTLKLPEKMRRLVNGGDDVCAESEGGKLWCTGREAAIVARHHVDPGHWEAYPTTASGFALASANVCAIDSSHGLACAGRFSEMSNPKPDVSKTAVSVAGLSDAIEIAVGDRFACARTKSSGVSCWGGSPESSAHPEPVTSLSDVTSVVAGGETACAMTKDGTFKCWRPGDESSQPTPYATPAIPHLAALNAGDWRVCALADGVVSCWGSGAYWQFGDSGAPDTGEQVAKPKPMKLSQSATAISSSNSASCAILENGRLSCWGSNRDGLLGRGTSSEGEGPGEVVSLEGVQRVAVGGEIACAVTKDGRASCWGEGAETPVPWPGAADVIDVSADADRDSKFGTCVVHATGSVECGLPNLARTIRGVERAKRVGGGYGFGCALLDDGTVRCWGERDYGQLGDGVPPITTTLAPVELP
jgi:alpha-tubulin suppressor-like RCC1 family protein